MEQWERKIRYCCIRQSLPGFNAGLEALGVSESELGNLGLRILKVGMIWPLDDVIVRNFAEDLDTILVVEEKRPLLEDQIKSILYGQDDAPNIVGKFLEVRPTALIEESRPFLTVAKLTQPPSCEF